MKDWDLRPFEEKYAEMLNKSNVDDEPITMLVKTFKEQQAAAFARGKAEGKKEMLDYLVLAAEDDFIVCSTDEWLKTMREIYLERLKSEKGGTGNGN